MPGPSGIDVLKELNANHYPAPILVISGWGDVPTVVNAVKNGAMDFIEKPFDPDTAVAQVQQAIDAWTRRHAASDGTYAPSQFPGWERLTPREREVLAQIAGGASSKEAGRHFGISGRTVEVHRTHIMLKLGAKNAADLVRIMFSESSDRQKR
jgi:FixJ family two-component response regulator